MGHAHVCAERALASGGIIAEKAAGQVPFKIEKKLGKCVRVWKDLFMSSYSCLLCLMKNQNVVFIL